MQRKAKRYILINATKRQALHFDKCNESSSYNKIIQMKLFHKYYNLSMMTFLASNENPTPEKVKDSEKNLPGHM